MRKRHAGEAACVEEARGSRVAKRQGTGLSGPTWTMNETEDLLQVPEKNGGTTGLEPAVSARDRVTASCNYLKSDGVGRHSLVSKAF